MATTKSVHRVGWERSRKKVEEKFKGKWGTRLRWRASQVALVVKNPPAMQETGRNAGLIPGSGRSPVGGYGNPIQYSCLKNAMDRGTWWATVHGVTKSQTQPK